MRWQQGKKGNQGWVRAREHLKKSDKANKRPTAAHNPDISRSSLFFSTLTLNIPRISRAQNMNKQLTRALCSQDSSPHSISFRFLNRIKAAALALLSRWKGKKCSRRQSQHKGEKKLFFSGGGMNVMKICINFPFFLFSFFCRRLTSHLQGAKKWLKISLSPCSRISRLRKTRRIHFNLDEEEEVANKQKVLIKLTSHSLFDNTICCYADSMYRRECRSTTHTASTFRGRACRPLSWYIDHKSVANMNHNLWLLWDLLKSLMTL